MIYEKLANIQKELFVPKDQKNDFGRYNYRSCEDILTKVKPLCEKNGCVLFLTNETIQIGNRNYIEAHARLVELETGEQVESVASAREAESKKGMDESQITGTASSYARKYALAGLFCIDNEKDADTNEYAEKAQGKALATDKQIKLLKDKMSEEQIKKMLEYYKVKKIELLSIDQASETIKGLNKKGE
jgi:hypothetical protein